jgi:hypothetical protein
MYANGWRGPSFASPVSQRSGSYSIGLSQYYNY